MSLGVLQCRRAVPSLLAIALLTTACARPSLRSMPESRQPAETVRRFKAPEASQAVAVDDRFFYAIGSAVIAKYDKKTGAAVASWRPPSGSHVAHLNSGIVVGRQLYCAHSNYPQTPMVSSIEIFDTDRMTHRRSVPLPNTFGSATWIDRADDGWWITFAHYRGRGGVPGKGPDATRLVHFSRNWKADRTYAFPPEVVTRWEAMSSSGGVRANRRTFITTGHDRPELYVVQLPATGGELTLRAVVPIESEGQGIALDSGARRLYSIQRRTGEVVVSTLPAALLRR